MSSNTSETQAPRPQRLVRTPTNPMASRPAQVAEPVARQEVRSELRREGRTEEPAVSHVQGAHPIESIAVDLEGAPAWRLAVIALGVALLSVVGLLVAS